MTWKGYSPWRGISMFIMGMTVSILVLGTLRSCGEWTGNQEAACTEAGGRYVGIKRDICVSPDGRVLGGFGDFGRAPE